MSAVAFPGLPSLRPVQRFALLHLVGVAALFGLAMAAGSDRHLFGAALAWAGILTIRTAAPGPGGIAAMAALAGAIYVAVVVLPIHALLGAPTNPIALRSLSEEIAGIAIVFAAVVVAAALAKYLIQSRRGAR